MPWSRLATDGDQGAGWKLAQCRSGTWLGWLAAGVILSVSAPCDAQSKPRCALLCAPELKVEPTWTIEHLASRHRIESNGQVERAER